MRAVLCLLLALSLAACDLGKKHDVERGTPATSEEFNFVAAKAYGGLSATEQQVGEYVRRGNFVRYLTAQGPQETLRSVEGRNLIQREEFENEGMVIFTYYVERVEFDGDEAHVYETEETEAYRWSPPSLNAAPRELSLFSAEEDGVYNLSYTEKTMPAPQAAQKRNCSGCQIQVRIIEFDTFLPLEGGGEKRIQHEYWISPDVPFSAHELKRCMSYSAQMEAIFVLITECLEVDDYSWGEPPLS